MIFLQRLYFGFKGLVFAHLAFEEVAGESGFFGHAGGGEDVDVAEFVFRLAEVLHLDPAFVDQGFQAVVQAAHAHAQLLGQLALGQVGVGLQQAHDSKSGVFLGLGGHGGLLPVFALLAVAMTFKNATALPCHDRLAREN